MAAGIPGSRFVALEGENHLFLEHEPAAARFFEEIKLFLGLDLIAEGTVTAVLTESDLVSPSCLLVTRLHRARVA